MGIDFRRRVYASLQWREDEHSNNRGDKEVRRILQRKRKKNRSGDISNIDKNTDLSSGSGSVHPDRDLDQTIEMQKKKKKQLSYLP